MPLGLLSPFPSQQVSVLFVCASQKQKNKFGHWYKPSIIKVIKKKDAVKKKTFSWFRYAATITEGDDKCKRWFMHRDENLLANHGSEKISETEGDSVTPQKKNNG